ncbi:MAG: galactokinase [Anaerolineae bacterium]|nr:galactokinase [Anaerolineae bacterium]
MSSSLNKIIAQQFEKMFGGPATMLVRAPGRVNLIGEHTDYNDGFVLPMAIDRAVWIALRPRDDRRVRLYSADFDETAEFSLDELRNEGNSWVEYIKGVAFVLQSEGYPVSGWEGVIAGDVPIGAGLSSSAAVEMASARAFAALDGWPWDARAMAKAGRRVENEWIGVNSGIMDQMISAAGRAGHALLIDCRSLETEAVPLPPGVAVVILDTMTRRGLVDSEYNDRRMQCERAAAVMGVPALRDADMELLYRKSGDLDPVTARRAKHVISEDQRTLDAAAVMRQGDAVAMGRLMNESHISMRDDFEISRREMDTMVELAQADPNCYGARMTGGGFGGAAVALVRVEGAEPFAAAVSSAYRQATGLDPQVYICAATDGAAVVRGA